MPEYDVFLCHASPDKPGVEKIGRQLIDAGLTPFLDKSNLIPGRDIQPSLEQAMNASASCAVFIGPGEHGRWHSQEIQLALQRKTREPEFGVIPVFLPGCPPDDELTHVPSFLMLKLGVDFRAGLDDGDALHRLVSGIRGKSPGLATARRRRSGEPGRLTVELRLEGDQLIRRYPGLYSQLVSEQQDSWTTFQNRFRGWCGIGAGAVKDDHLDKAIFDLLFWGQRGYFHQDVLAAVFPDDKVKPNPNRHPVRLRLHLNDARLADLPWSCLGWEGMSLAAMDWTLELAAPGDNTSWPERHVRLHTPCSVLIIAPHRDRLSSADHAKAMEYKFRDLWRGAEIQTATTHAEIQATVQDRYPRIVYFHGEARQTDDALNLFLDDGDLDLATLNDLWQQNPPQILFLDLVDEGRLNPNWPVRDIARSIPLLIVQHWPLDEIQTARDNVLRWFHELLTNDDPFIEPVGILHRHSVCTAMAWTGYGGWKTDTVDRTHPSTRKPLAKLLLDRDEQRGRALQALSELTTDQNRRMTCLLCYGGPGNLAGRFGEQLFAYLEQQTVGDSRLHLQRITLDLPPGDAFDRRDMHRKVLRRFNLRSEDSLTRTLDRLKPLLPGNPTTVLLLDWQARDLDNPGLTSDALEEWLHYCREWLSERCPAGMCLLGCLTLEAPLDRHDGLAGLFRDLGEDGSLLADTFQLELLDPLHNVERSHLAKYLASSDCKCPAELQTSMPELILGETRGRFETTADLIDEAEGDLGWWGLQARLVKPGKPAAPSSSPRPRGNRRL